MCGPVADSYIRLALVYSAHPSCSPSVFFTHPSSKYTPLEKPFEKIPPSPTPHAKNIQPRPPLQPTPPLAALFSFCLLHCCPSHLFTSCTQCQFIISHSSMMWYDSMFCFVFSPLFRLPFLLAPSPFLAPLPDSLLLKPPRPLGNSADIESQPSLHQASQSDIQPTSPLTNQLTTQPASWPDEEWSSYRGLSGVETLWTDEFSGHTNTEETQVDFLEVSS